MEERNVKIARQLLKLAKSLVAREPIKNLLSLNIQETSLFNFENLNHPNDPNYSWHDQMVVSCSRLVFDYNGDIDEPGIENDVKSDLLGILSDVVFDGTPLFAGENGVNCGNIEADKTMGCIVVNDLSIEMMEEKSESVWSVLEGKGLV